jgi:hypothetical protein
MLFIVHKQMNKQKINMIRSQKIHLMQKDKNVAVRQVKINVILNSYNIEENKEF